MLDAGLLADGRLEMSAELVFRFETYWSFVLDLTILARTATVLRDHQV